MHYNRSLGREGVSESKFHPLFGEKNAFWEKTQQWQWLGSGSPSWRLVERSPATIREWDTSSRKCCCIEGYPLPQFQMVHASYTCDEYVGGETRPYPTRREGGFWLGSGTRYPPLLKECPLKCRPKDHPDWVNCWDKRGASTLNWAVRGLIFHLLTEWPRNSLIKRQCSSRLWSLWVLLESYCADKSLLASALCRKE